ncbi:MAG: hypothetical protein HC877_03540 [Thioploca sp.]|nr:hypothetical protein [Thioploca sp.]
MRITLLSLFLSVGEFQHALRKNDLALIIILFLISGSAFFQTLAAEKLEPVVSQPLNLEEQWGIKLIGVQLSAAGYMLDFRYQVIDPNKAKYLTEQRQQTYLIDQATGARFIVPSPPKVGSLRQRTSEPKAKQIYFMLFANPNRFIKSGNQVTVVIGDFQAKNLTVK